MARLEIRRVKAVGPHGVQGGVRLGWGGAKSQVWLQAPVLSLVYLAISDEN